MREIRYQSIADTLRQRIRRGEYAPGEVLASEASFSKEFGVSRVTMRRALEQLRDGGLVASRQGFGWFVAAAPIRQDLARLRTIEEQMASDGITPERKVLEFEFVDASPRARDVLAADRVLRVKRLNLADGEPFAVVTVWCPAQLASGFSLADVERAPFYELLGMAVEGARQTIGADVATSEIATLLAIPAGSPVLRCERVTTTADGRAVLLSEHVFAAHRTEFVVDLPHSPPSISPTGLRLLDGSAHSN